MQSYFNFKSQFTKLLPVVGGAITIFSSSAQTIDRQAENRQKPNVVYILADDLGYGDLGCYGQKHFLTPNIDRLAKEGMLFTQHYAGCTVCAPSRSSLMTGQTTGHTPIRGNKAWQPEGQWPIPDSTITIAEVLHDAGYITGCFGKWGLGYPGSEGDPNKQGFDEFFGYNCQRLAHNYYPSHLWHNQEEFVLGKNQGDQNVTYSPELIQEYAIRFIQNNKNRPFFMYYATTLPHAELLLPEKYISKYKGKFLPEKSYKGANQGDKNFRNGAYGSQSNAHAAFAAMVTLLDTQVGEIINELKKLGLSKNTLVIFSSDNGPHQEGGGDPDYFNSNGPLRGYKRDLYEGGIREPMIAYWPEKIEAGAETDHISAFWDVMPTLAELAGVKTPENIDGLSFLPTLLGKSGQKNHAYLYWEFHEQNGRQAIRKDNWKLVCYHVMDQSRKTIELFDLKEDIGEQHNVASKHPEIVNYLLKLMNEARSPSSIFPFNAEVKTQD